jgi:flagellar basal body-associated protein FliL
MKIDIPTDKIKDFLRARTRLIITIAFVIFVFSLGIATYYVLFPGEDESVAGNAAKKEQELNINFDKKVLQELENKKSPSVITETGGRNPFLPY